MILADTSVWTNHWVVTDLGFARLLVERQILMHPFVLGELAMGSLKNRRSTLAGLRDLHVVPTAPDEDVLMLVEAHSLFSRGIATSMRICWRHANLTALANC
ncbi:hypothetical protein SAMN05216456_2119 [Devosia crocina]|uniref:PIN domain-containing protein n=1 Tax=Devosia crocina TaxID=429728 RepID=A0A1I7NKV6_9HYPH|nr:hypothetical protein [Devosia crocina]SFV35314.1 hypothetical protein SAMN05216456_2119 [Devosia crocina]